MGAGEEKSTCDFETYNVKHFPLPPPPHTHRWGREQKGVVIGCDTSTHTKYMPPKWTVFTEDSVHTSLD